MKIAILALFFIATIHVSAQLTQQHIATDSGSIGFYQFKPSDYNTNPAYQYPVIIMLHGLGERGDGNADLPNVLYDGIGKLLKNGATMRFSLYGKPGAFIVLLPQMSKKYEVWQPYYIDEMIKYAKANLRINPNKIFITGYSLGGGGTWVYPASSLTAAQQIAGIIPISAACLNDTTYPQGTYNIAKGGVALWAFHSTDDIVVPFDCTHNTVDSIINKGPLVPVQTRYTAENHWVYTSVYSDTSNNYMYPNIYQWMLGVSRSTTQANNQAPVAVVGVADSTIVVTPQTAKKTLDATASYDPSDIIMNYKWELTSGSASNVFLEGITWQPAQFPINKPIVKLEFNKLGVYEFKLTVTDMFGVTHSQTKKITITNNGVNTAPYVELGNAQTIKPPTNSIFMNPQVFDWEGNLKYQWKQLSGPATASFQNPTWYQSNINGLTAPGNYIFELTVSDGITSTSDQVVVSVQGILSIVYAFFKAKHMRNDNLLSWGTVTEYNNDRFEIQRSQDGHIFYPIDTIPAVANPINNGSETIRYSYLDTSVTAAYNYYRIKQYDKDNAYSLSPIVFITNYNNIDPNIYLEVYPNPFSNQLWIQLTGNISGDFTIKLFDIKGQFIQQSQFTKNSNYIGTKQSFHVESLPAGMYFMEISQPETGWKQIRKIVKF